MHGEGSIEECWVVEVRSREEQRKKERRIERGQRVRRRLMSARRSVYKIMWRLADFGEQTYEERGTSQGWLNGAAQRVATAAEHLCL